MPVLFSLLERQTDRTVVPRAVLPVADNLARRAAVGHRTVLACLAARHMVQNVFHGFAVRQVALPLLAVSLVFTTLAVVRMQEQQQLLLDELALLWICRHWSRPFTREMRDFN